MKLFNQVRKYGSKVAKVAVAGGALLISSGAFAALDTGITTAMDTAKADVTSLGGLALAVVIAAVVFKYMRRSL